MTAPPATAIDWHAFLARPPLPTASEKTLASLCERSILITGAGGSIGKALSLRVAALRPRRLLLLDASEQSLYRLQIALEYASFPNHSRLILGNCNDSALLDEILEPHQLIFHAAAFKHVPLLEQYPLEALANNALTTLTLAEDADRAGAARIVLLSTDKAAAPANILGASKRIAERIVLDHGGIALRLGNVLGSEGSVSEAFVRQLNHGAAIAITTPEAERYFLTCNEAVDLLLTAAVAADAKSLLAPQIARQHRIVELASFLTHALSPAQEPSIVFTGPRPGDKQSEVFWSDDEQSIPSGIASLLQLTLNRSHNLLPRSILQTLDEAVRGRDLPAAIDCVMRLVPGYAPSETILAQLPPSEVRR